MFQNSMPYGRIHSSYKQYSPNTPSLANRQAPYRTTRYEVGRLLFPATAAPAVSPLAQRISSSPPITGSPAIHFSQLTTTPTTPPSTPIIQGPPNYEEWQRSASRRNTIYSNYASPITVMTPSKVIIPSPVLIATPITVQNAIVGAKIYTVSREERCFGTITCIDDIHNGKLITYKLDKNENKNEFYILRNSTRSNVVPYMYLVCNQV